MNILFLLFLVSQASSSALPCPEGTLLPNPTDCSKFYKCSAGSPRTQSCAAQLLYNTALQTCDWPEAVDCVKVAVEESDPSPSRTMALTASRTGSSSSLSRGEMKVAGQPAGSVLVASVRAGVGQQGRQKMEVKYIPRDVARYEAELGVYNINRYYDN
eukprot:GFUD01029893.1.p1 GENE.GFUD01029893.1~~GFUD01029893.1.p1  ORF type:complete len:158 (-),score=52.79 GFUD01029893.1:21-494(-)